MSQGYQSRRGFLNETTGAMMAAGLPPWFARRVVADEQERKAAEERRKVGPNDEIALGVIGTGGQGVAIMKTALNQKGVRVAAVCDVDAGRRAKAVEEVRKIRPGAEVAAHGDFRELVARDDLDAVLVGTVDHWHALASIAAMRDGLDVYCEKPLSLTIAEGQAMLRAARKYDRIFQTGSMQRSDARYRLVCDLVRAGRIGKVHTVEARIGENPVGGPFPASEPPRDLDWDFWKGPTPDVPYVKEKCHYTFRWWYEYSGGKLTDWGAHHHDIAQWGLNRDDSGPVSVTAVGLAPPREPSSYNCHPHFSVEYEYADGTRLLSSSLGENGNRFIGEDGWVFVSRSRMEASDPEIFKQPTRKDALGFNMLANHMANFLDGVRTRARPVCDVEVGHRSATVCHLGSIALRLGRPLRWDPEEERFVGPDADQGNAMIAREYRAPWKLEV